MELTKEQIFTLCCLKEVNVKGIGPKKIFSLAAIIKDYNYNVNTLEDLFEIMQGMKEKVFHKISLTDLNNAYNFAKSVMEKSEKINIKLTGYFDDDYPKLLRETINEEGKLDPPLYLWYKGDLKIANMESIAIIGTREPTLEGIKGGEFISSEFAKRGFNIVSGLAVGCDTCGHKGALKVNGKTTAILGNGLDDNSIYPTENKQLAKEIIEKGGLLLSEYSIGSIVNRYSLVARDRLQAGMSLATLVIQTGERGGTMHAANTTLKANKRLYTMLYKDDITNNHEKCLGNALLVKKGARYISGDTNIDVICEEIKKYKNINQSLFDQ